MNSILHMRELLHDYWRADRQRRDHQVELGFSTDVRLLIMAIVLWVGTYLGFSVQWNIWSFLAWAYFFLIFLCASAILYARPSVREGATVLLTCLLLLGFQVANLEVRNIAGTSRALASLEDSTVRVQGEVVRAQRLTPDTQLITLKATQIRNKNQSYTAHRNLTFFHSGRSISGESEIEVIGTVSADGPQILLDNTFTKSGSGDLSRTEDLKTELAHYLSTQIGANPTALTLGLAYGDDSLLEEQATENFRVTGLTHLTAVSGSNIALIFVLGYRTLSYLRVRRKILICVAVGLTLAYATFVGWEGSVIRAWTMGTLGALAVVLGHGKDLLSVLASALTLLLVLLPELAFNLGFILSAIATASLIILAPALSRLLAGFMPQSVSDLLAIPISATLWCTPVLIPVQEKIGFYSVPANFCATPVVPLLTVFGLLVAGSFALGLSPLVTMLSGLSQVLATYLLAIAGFFATAPGASTEVSDPRIAAFIAFLVTLIFTGTVILLDFLFHGRSQVSAFERKSVI